MMNELHSHWFRWQFCLFLLYKLFWNTEANCYESKSEGDYEKKNILKYTVSYLHYNHN